MARTYPDNICWVCCCCGCYPIIGLIKGAIVVGPILILSLIGFNGCCIILLPHDIFLTYKALLKTSLIGINLKIMGIFFLPIALITWSILVLVGSIIFGILFGLFYPVSRTFDDTSNIIYGGFAETFEGTCEVIKYFWDYNYNRHFSYLRELEKVECDDPFDINIIQIIICLILAVYGSVVGITVLIIMWLIKLFPHIYRMYYDFFEMYCGMKRYKILMYLLFFIIGLSLVPVGGVLCIFGYIVSGLYGGLLCAIEGYKYNVDRGTVNIWETIHHVIHIVMK